MGKVTKEKRIGSMNDVVDMASDLMSEVYNDGKLTAAEKNEKFCCWSACHLRIRAEKRKTALDLARMGMKAEGQANQLTFEAPISSPDTSQ